MPKSKDSKLFPLFYQSSKVSTVANIDDSASDGDDDEDDLPLTSLLMESQTKIHPARKSYFKPPKQKKGNKRLASAVTDNTRVAKNKTTCLTECKKQKQRNILDEPCIQSDGNKSSIFNVAAIAKENRPASITKDIIFNKSECNEVGRCDAGRVVNSCKDKGFSPKASRNVNQRPTGRLYSDASMDFVPPYHLHPESEQRCVKEIKNVVHKLNRRIANGGCLSQHRHNRHFSPFSKARIIQNKKSSISSSYCWPNKWRIPSWISLEQPSTGGGVSGSRNIDHIRWDPMGVLLAVAIDRTIVIYDWDMLRAADLQGRSDRARNCQESEFKIPPIVKFRLPHHVASLVWNPFEMDELAVGFRVSGEARIYNINQVARWLSKNPSRNIQRLPPQSTYKKIKLQRVTGSVGEMMFLDIQNVLVSVGRILYRWQLSLSNDSKGRQQRVPATAGILVWRYQPPSHATSMAPIGSNIVIIGTNHGHMCLIDWTKRTKVSLSFCHEHRPKVIQTWVPHDRLKAPNQDKSLRNRMGIMKMRVETSNEESVVGKRHWGRCRVKWVTQSGWLLSMMLDSIRIPDNCLVHYSSPEVVFKNADGSLINTDRKSWSLPYNTMGIDLCNKYSACFVGVPTVTKILSHHDKFVLDSQPSTVVSKEKVFVVHGIDDEIHKIPFPGVVNDLPQALAVHPSLEWIVVGERNRLHIMVSSGRAKMKI